MSNPGRQFMTVLDRCYRVFLSADDECRTLDGCKHGPAIGTRRKRLLLVPDALSGLVPDHGRECLIQARMNSPVVGMKEDGCIQFRHRSPVFSFSQSYSAFATRTLSVKLRARRCADENKTRYAIRRLMQGRFEYWVGDKFGSSILLFTPRLCVFG